MSHQNKKLLDSWHSDGSFFRTLPPVCTQLYCVTAPSPQRSVATRISLQLSRRMRILSLRLKMAVCLHRRRQRKQGPFHKPNPLDALFEKDIGKRCSVRSLVLLWIVSLTTWALGADLKDVFFEKPEGVGND